MMSVWRDHASLLVRSYVEQELDMQFSTVTGFEKIRIFPPGLPPDERVAVFMPPVDLAAVMQHRMELREKYPNLHSNNVSELPNPVQFKWAMPALVRRWVKALDSGRSAEELERARWFDTAAWRFEQ